MVVYSSSIVRYRVEVMRVVGLAAVRDSARLNKLSSMFATGWYVKTPASWKGAIWAKRRVVLARPSGVEYRF